MRSVGIITIVKVNNYGAELQAFALQRKLELMGYRAEIIDYLFYKHPQHKREKCSEPFYPYPFKKRCKEWLLPKWEWLKCRFHKEASDRRDEGFYAFHQKNTRFSVHCYKSYTELYNNPPQYDVYCVGSDQVWNPGCYTSLNPYFVSFAPKGKRKISYASSFGVKNIPHSARMKYQTLLEDMDAISVREDAGVKLVKDLSGKTAVKVTDPTLLLTKEEWSAVAKFDKVPREKYILLYVLKDSDYITQQAIALGKIKGLKVIRICKGAFKQDKNSSGIENIIDAAPDDFLGLISKAEMILTNSFHGTVFSILFERDFYTIVKRSVENNSRQLSLLDTLKIDRIKYEDTTFKEATSINWKMVGNALSDFRQKSIDYLNQAVNG